MFRHFRDDNVPLHFVLSLIQFQSIKALSRHKYDLKRHWCEILFVVLFIGRECDNRLCNFVIPAKASEAALILSTFHRARMSSTISL